MSNQELWLITGGSGFLSVHCIATVLAAGYRVRTTIRSPLKKAQVLSGLAKSDPPVDYSPVEFVETDLLKDEGWDQAMKDVSVVLHVASPFPAIQPKDENKLIKPAVEGTLRVLKAAKRAGTVKRVVVTSSAVAISYGHPRPSHGEISTFTEEDWTNVEGNITPYSKSKTLAEKAAWEFMRTGGGSENGMELSVVNPVGIFGPPFIVPTESTTCGLIKQMLDGSLPAVPNVVLGVVDVRDVATLHLLAATKPQAAGQRYLAVAGRLISFLEMANILRTLPNGQGKKAPTKVLPNWLVRFMALFMTQLGAVLPELGNVYELSNEKAKSLGWNPRSNEEAILSCAQTLLAAKK